MQGPRLLFILLICFGLLVTGLVELQAQQQQPSMRVAQTDDQGRAIRFDFNFTSISRRFLNGFHGKRT